MRMRYYAACLFGCVALAGCDPATSGPTAVFQDVNSPEKWSEQEIVRDYGRVKDVPEFVRDGGHLYLLTQITQNHLLAVHVVPQETWSADRVAVLKAQHPEIANLLPRSSAKTWIGR